MAASSKQIDLFIATASDVSPKAHQDLMTRCWWSLAKQKRIAPIEHYHDESWVKVSGDAEYGIATIYDFDIMIYAIAQLVHNLNNKMAVGRRFEFTAYDYYKFTGRKSKGGRGYKELWAALERLHHTYVKTNIRQGQKHTHHSFVWLSDIKQNFDGKRHRGYEITLPEWLFDSVVNDNLILTLDDGYFDIKSGLEKWLYLYARKTSGYSKTGWVESIENIYQKSGSKGTISEFRRQIRKILSKGEILGYNVEWQGDIKGKQSLVFPRKNPRLTRQNSRK